MVLAISAIDNPIIPSLLLASIRGDSIPLVAQALAPLGGDVGSLEEVLIEVEDVPTPLKEAFVVEAITPPVVAPVETSKAIRPQGEMIGTTSPLEETMVKVVDPIYTPKESLMETTFNSPMVPSSNNLP